MRKTLVLTAMVLSGSLAAACSDTGTQRTTSRPSTAQPSAQTAPSGQKAAQQMSQSDMQKVEQALKAKGYDPGPVDGKLDSQTQAAIRDVQKKNNLPVTGMMDKRTADALGLVIIIAE